MSKETSATSKSSLTVSQPFHLETNLISINSAAQAPLKLTSENYISWHTQWYSLLLGYDLFSYVDGTNPCPPAMIKEDNIETSNPNYKFWVRQDQLLRSALVASLSPEVIPFVASAKSSNIVWSKLETMYAKPTRGRIMGIRDNLSKTSKGNESISTYMQKIKTPADSMAIAGAMYAKPTRGHIMESKE